MKYRLDEKFILNEDDTEDLFATSAKRDWATLIKNAQNSGNQQEVQKLWDQYFEEEWGNDAQHAKNLGDALIIELTSLGFSANVNPFINYVKELFKKKIYPDFDTYGAVHNSYNRGKVSNKMLAGNDILGKNNIIFSTDLFAHNSADILDYISLWSTCHMYIKSKELVDNEILRLRYTKDPANGKISEVDKFFTDVFFQPGNAISKNEIRGNVTGKLNEISRIQEVLTLCFNAEAKLDAEEKLDADAELILNDFVNKDSGRAKAAISYIAKMKMKDAADMKVAIAKATNNDFNIDNNKEIAFAGWLKSKNLRLPNKKIDDILIAIGKGVGLVK